jgi:hypothetical protein
MLIKIPPREAPKMDAWESPVEGLGGKRRRKMPKGT